MSNSLDPDHDGHFVQSDLGPNCLQMLSADSTSKKRVYGDNSSKLESCREIANLDIH